MRKLAMLAAACVLFTACSSRALRPPEDVWEVALTPRGAAAVAPDDGPERPAVPD